MTYTTIDLKIINPIKPLTYGAMIFFALWGISPITFIYEGGIKSTTILTLCITSLFLGVVLGARTLKSTNINLHISPLRLNKLTNYTLTLGLIGMALRAFERIVLRAGGNISSNFAENRELISTGGSGPLALVSATFASLLIFLPFLAFLLKKCGTNKKNYINLFPTKPNPPTFRHDISGLQEHFGNIPKHFTCISSNNKIDQL